MNTSADTSDRATRLGERFADLHRSGTFVMINVADVGTATAVVEAGAVAIATTSGGHAASIGREDAAGEVSLEEHAAHTAVLAGGVEVPCNADAENGYGHEPEAMAAAVHAFAAAGAAGIGIEDWSGDPAVGCYDRVLAAERIAAAVEAAATLDRPFVITGRTEILLYGLAGGLDEALTRLQSFAAVGAQCLYAPGAWDLETNRVLAAEAGGPINALVPLAAVHPEGRVDFDVADLAAAGVRRISIGGSLYRSQVEHAAERVRTLLGDGTF